MKCPNPDCRAEIDCEAQDKMFRATDNDEPSSSFWYCANCETKIYRTRKCPKCKGELRRVESAVYTGSNPSVHPILPPHWRCDNCRIGSYDLKTWYNSRGIVKVAEMGCGEG